MYAQDINVGPRKYPETPNHEVGRQQSVAKKLGPDHVDCPSCWGEKPPYNTCTLCNEQGQVSASLAHIWSAARSVARDGGVPDADSGITRYALARWYEQRAAIEVDEVSGLPPGRATDGDYLTTVKGVTLYSKLNQELPFTGFAWGYGGEGANGLAALLADALPTRFPTRASALLFVSRLDGNKPFTVDLINPLSEAQPS